MGGQGHVVPPQEERIRTLGVMMNPTHIWLSGVSVQG